MPSPPPPPPHTHTRTHIMQGDSSVVPPPLCTTAPGRFCPWDSPHGCPGAHCALNMCKGQIMDELLLGTTANGQTAPHATGAEGVVGGEPAGAVPSSSAGAGGSAGVSGDGAASGGSALPSTSATGTPRPPVLYVGDGGGDLCACIRLSAAHGDVVLARGASTEPGAPTRRFPLLGLLRKHAEASGAAATSSPHPPTSVPPPTVVPWTTGAVVRDTILTFLGSP
jgi:hypothetical protein